MSDEQIEAPEWVPNRASRVLRYLDNARFVEDMIGPTRWSGVVGWFDKAGEALVSALWRTSAPPTGEGALTVQGERWWSRRVRAHAVLVLRQIFRVVSELVNEDYREGFQQLKLNRYLDKSAYFQRKEAIEDALKTLTSIPHPSENIEAAKFYLEMDIFKRHGTAPDPDVFVATMRSRLKPVRPRRRVLDVELYGGRVCQALISAGRINLVGEEPLPHTSARTRCSMCGPFEESPWVGGQLDGPVTRGWFGAPQSLVRAARRPLEIARVDHRGISEEKAIGLLADLQDNLGFEKQSRPSDSKNINSADVITRRLARVGQQFRRYKDRVLESRSIRLPLPAKYVDSDDLS